MESPDRRMRSGFGESTLSLLAVCTLIAGIGFTPWAWSTGLAWAEGASWSTRALLVASAVFAAVSVHTSKSLEVMANLHSITGLFIAAARSARGSSHIESTGERGALGLAAFSRVVGHAPRASCHANRLG